ncbi:MAG: hypothetical protein KBG15_11415 [Kofleriaceae bacterium]|nr:hypothetical protein [Kofleriaceae bacterium]
MARRGKILAIKWGMNPNSSSLGVDVTFLIAGAAMIAMATPVVGALLRLRGQRLHGASANAGATAVPTLPVPTTTASDATTDANHDA